MSEKPDFVIAGAAKCGTTALYEYLSKHPSVFMPTLKEPGFFSTDLPGGVASLAEYRALFAAAPPDSFTGEASTQYVYSRVAIPGLMAHNPNVRVIVMLRNPVDAAHSLHGFAYRYRHENIADFERAWREQPARLGREERAGPDSPVIEYDYRATYRYAEQVRRVLDHVPASQRHFVVYEDFFADPSSHYAGILEFLGLTPVNPQVFALVNAHVGVRSSRLERLLRQPPKWLRAVHAPLRPLLKAARLRPLDLLGRMNWTRQPKHPLRPAFRRDLERYFSDDITELERLLGRRLWKAGA
jgi:Sulfotransferase domain